MIIVVDYSAFEAIFAYVIYASYGCCHQQETNILLCSSNIVSAQKYYRRTFNTLKLEYSVLLTTGKVYIFSIAGATVMTHKFLRLKTANVIGLMPADPKEKQKCRLSRELLYKIKLYWQNHSVALAKTILRSVSAKTFSSRFLSSYWQAFDSFDILAIAPNILGTITHIRSMCIVPVAVDNVFVC